MLRRARALEDQLVAWRREFHQNPELGFQETRTAGRVAEILEGMGYRVRTGVGRTGVVAERGTGKPMIAIRADMDALPLQETNPVPYASVVPNVMHACGHDAHTAILLGVASLLSEEELAGTVRLLFQPAEEIEDEEGLSGAPRMVAEGAVEGVDAVMALHVDAALPTGSITLGDGPSSAGVDTFYAAIIGRGGHGAAPHRTVDTVYLAGHVILALNGIVSRRIDPCIPAVVSIGSIHGGQADNVIPERITLSGTIRYMELAVQTQLHAEIENAFKLACHFGGDYELRIVKGYPPMFNETGLVSLLESVAVDLLGAEKIDPPTAQMGAEDFGFFSQQAPGAMFMLGCRIEGDERAHHSPRFDIDEDCLPVGAAILAETALRFLRGAR